MTMNKPAKQHNDTRRMPCFDAVIKDVLDCLGEPLYDETGEEIPGRQGETVRYYSGSINMPGKTINPKNDESCIAVMLYANFLQQMQLLPDETRATLCLYRAIGHSRIHFSLARKAQGLEGRTIELIITPGKAVDPRYTAHVELNEPRQGRKNTTHLPPDISKAYQIAARHLNLDELV